MIVHDVILGRPAQRQTLPIGNQSESSQVLSREAAAAFNRIGLPAKEQRKTYKYYFLAASHVNQYVLCHTKMSSTSMKFASLIHMHTFERADNE